jgi:hypothetical protein
MQTEPITVEPSVIEAGHSPFNISEALNLANTANYQAQQSSFTNIAQEVRASLEAGQ